MQRYVNTVTSRGGAAISGASVLVKTYPGGTDATIYSDDGTTETTNPLTTDANGQFAFYAEDGRYSLVISKTGVIEQRTLTDAVHLWDPADGDTEQSAADVSFTQSGSGESAGVATNLATLLKPLRVLGSGSESHSDGTDTLTGSARWFLGNGSPSSDDSALLIGRSLTGGYDEGAHAIRDESTWTITGTGLVGYASYDAQPTITTALAGNHVHAFQARQIYSGAGTMNVVAGFTFQPQLTGPVNACRGLQITEPTVTGSGAITEFSGVTVLSQTKGTTIKGIDVRIAAASGRYSVYTGTAQSYFGGAVSVVGDLTLTGNVLPAANNRITFRTETGTNLWLHGTGTIGNVSSINDAGNSYQPMFINGSILAFYTGTGGSIGEALRITSTRNLCMGVTAAGSNAVQVLCIETGTAPTTGPADTVQFYSSDNSAGNTIPSFYCEGTEVIATGQADSASSVRVKMRINGTVVTLLAI